jgi:ComF family protein
MPEPSRASQRRNARRATLGTVLIRLLGVLAPPLCVVCRADAGRAAPVCRECRALLARTADGRMRGGVWAAFSYDGPAGAIVRALKFGGGVALADVMAGHIAALAPPALLSGALVPVPLHRARERKRGFNHAQKLAEALGRRAGVPVAGCLRRTGDPGPQMGRGRSARLRSPAVSVQADGVVPVRALLVDDVVTTGATIAACAAALRQGGCREIGALTYARTPGR